MELRRWLVAAFALSSLFAAGCNKCGNGEIQSGEQCDDGNEADGDGCDANCQLVFDCGDGFLASNAAAGIFEFCDNGALNGTGTPNEDGVLCDANCRIQFDADNHRCSLPAGFQNGFGGCCNSGDDCASGTCSFGYCDLPVQQSCAQDADCANALAADADIVNASPFPAGTTFKCANFLTQDPQFGGLISQCVPGSATKCEAAADGRCPAGETCSLGFDLVGGNNATQFFGGVCTTDYLGSAKPGEFCTGDETKPYECSAGLFFFVPSCLNNTCYSACDGTEANSAVACGDPNLECLGPIPPVVDITGQGDPLVGGGGFCIGRNCGGFTVSLDGADESVILDNCAAGFSCNIVGPFVDEDEFLYQCSSDDPNGADFAEPCEQDPFFGQGCRVTSLCLQAGATQDPNGADCLVTDDCCPGGPGNCDLVCAGADVDQNGNPIPGNCSPRPAPGFCSEMCESHDSCQIDPNVPATCIDLGVGGNLTSPVCFPNDQIFNPGTVICDEESDCTVGDEGCLAQALAGVGDRAGLGICVDADDTVANTKVVGDACNAVDVAAGSGTACANDNGCNVVGEVCVDVDGAGPGGGTCRPTITECRSAICADELLDIKDDNNVLTQAFCTSYCLTNADCPTTMECTPVLTSDNGGIGAGNLIGLCTPLAPADAADNCTADAVNNHNSCEVDEAAGSGLDCTVGGDTVCAVNNEVCFNNACRPLIAGEGDSCDVATGACFTAASVVGTACQTNADCDLGAECAGADPVAGTDGQCLFNGCDPADDLTCPDAGNLCLSNGLAAPGTCLLGCDSSIANGADPTCTNVNADLTCLDLGVGNNQGVCVLP